MRHAAHAEFTPNFADLLERDGKSSLEEYGRFQQHLVLLEDPGRIGAYLTAIRQAPPGDVVVDVGAGTGILGMLALKCGFQHAILIEPSRKMGEYIRHLATLNGVQDRITVIESTLEALRPAALPRSIDLIVTETLSSLLFGFGCWDALSGLAERLTDPRRIVPLRGRLFAAATHEPLATRGPSSDGLALLRDAGIVVDLFERTFRSGGNVYDKAVVARLLSEGILQPVQIASFDFTRSPQITLSGANVGNAGVRTYCGVVTFWEVDLATDSPVTITNLDPRISSWYPFYVPFVKPIYGPFDLRMKLVPFDAPYKYAFQFVSDDEDITNVLYW